MKESRVRESLHRTDHNAAEVLSVVVPCYNEVATVRQAILGLLQVQLPLNLEVLMVDDGSTDGSADAVKDLVEEGKLTLIIFERNQGKGAAVRAGITESSGTLLSIFDADLECDAEDYCRLVKAFFEGKGDVVYGARSFGPHNCYSFWFVLGNKILALFTSLLFNTWISDPATCLKLARRDTWHSLGLRSAGFSIDAEATAKFLRGGYRIYEVPVEYNARTRKEGKKVKFRDGISSLAVLMTIRFFRRPVKRESWAKLSVEGDNSSVLSTSEQP